MIFFTSASKYVLLPYIRIKLSEFETILIKGRVHVNTCALIGKVTKSTYKKISRNYHKICLQHVSLEQGTFTQ